MSTVDLLRPLHRKLSERGRASGSEGGVISQSPVIPPGRSAQLVPGKFCDITEPAVISSEAYVVELF